jgi:hypothetical protein
MCQSACRWSGCTPTNAPSTILVSSDIHRCSCALSRRQLRGKQIPAGSRSRGLLRSDRTPWSTCSRGRELGWSQQNVRLNIEGAGERHEDADRNVARAPLDGLYVREMKLGFFCQALLRHAALSAKSTHVRGNAFEQTRGAGGHPLELLALPNDPVIASARRTTSVSHWKSSGAAWGSSVVTPSRAARR